MFDLDSDSHLVVKPVMSVYMFNRVAAKSLIEFLCTGIFTKHIICCITLPTLPADAIGLYMTEFISDIVGGCKGDIQCVYTELHKLS